MTPKTVTAADLAELLQLGAEARALLARTDEAAPAELPAVADELVEIGERMQAIGLAPVGLLDRIDAVARAAHRLVGAAAPATLH